MHTYCSDFTLSYTNLHNRKFTGTKTRSILNKDDSWKSIIKGTMWQVEVTPAATFLQKLLHICKHSI